MQALSIVWLRKTGRFQHIEYSDSIENKNMRWLRSILRIFSKSVKPNQRENSDASFFAVSVQSDQLICTWKIRDESKTMIQRNFNSALFIRIKDISGDQSISSKVIQVSLNQDTTNIHLPSKSGKILIDLGYKSGLDFMTLEYQVLDLGPKKVRTNYDVNWFAEESDNIHEEMYKLSTGGRPLGGSEMVHKD